MLQSEPLCGPGGRQLPKRSGGKSDSTPWRRRRNSSLQRAWMQEGMGRLTLELLGEPFQRSYHAAYAHELRMAAEQRSRSSELSELRDALAEAGRRGMLNEPVPPAVFFQQKLHGQHAMNVIRPTIASEEPFLCRMLSRVAQRCTSANG